MKEGFSLLVIELKEKKGTTTLEALDLITMFNDFERELYYRSQAKRNEAWQKNVKK